MGVYFLDPSDKEKDPNFAFPLSVPNIAPVITENCTVISGCYVSVPPKQNTSDC